MVISISCSLFSSPNFTVDSKRSPQSHPFSNSSSVRYNRLPTSASFATAERTTTTTETETNISFRTFSQRSLYEVLGVQIGADTREVKSAYRRLARVLHPDVGSCESSADEFMKVQSAYATLADPAKRAEYDRSLVQRRAGGLPPMRVAGGYSRRWETDQCW